MGKKRSKFYNNHIPKGKKGQQWLEEAEQNFNEGHALVYYNSLFSPMLSATTTYRVDSQENLCPPDGYAVVTNNGDIFVNPTVMLEANEWAYIIAHCLLHLGLGHFQAKSDALHWNVACDRVVACFLQEFKFGKAPERMNLRLDTGIRDEDKLYQQLLQSNLSDALQIYSTAAIGQEDMVFEPVRVDWHNRKPDWESLFGRGLSNAVTNAVHVVSGREFGKDYKPNSPAEKCKAWFMNHFPLLGALATAFKVYEDAQLCYRMEISVAAVNAELGEIYFNPAAFEQWDDEQRLEEYRFVMAHELLHVALRHQARRQGRDAFLWNVACDYVINQWLVEMGVGRMPALGLLYDPELKGLNAETIYDRIVNDLRLYRKSTSLTEKLYRHWTTFRGKGMGDMLEGGHPAWWETGEGTTLDDFYRRALAQGLQYHQACGRGYIPAGLIEEIMAIGRPPIAWDVELAQWFDAHFPPLELRRTYARPSRRQSSTPDIPRPRYVKQEIDVMSRTFGVVLDTSGSMSRDLLAKALGSIASYAIVREVPFVRVIFCDADAYDEGYMPPEDIAGKVKVRGRGGTILMPGIRKLEEAEDFPKEGPMLIITDTQCDRLTVRAPRDHAYLVPKGQRLPFPTHAPVFYVE
jgi:predicted metal-dependent peptidase